MSTKGTPCRAVRIPDELWTAALQTARDRGDYLSDIIRAGLQAYIEKSDHDQVTNLTPVPSRPALRRRQGAPEGPRRCREADRAEAGVPAEQWARRGAAAGGAEVSMGMFVSQLLPITPTMEEDVIRIVRHGLADVLEWLGEEVGPKPGDQTHVIVAGSQLIVSQAFADKAKELSASAVRKECSQC